MLLKDESGFTKRYIFALSLIALFSILAYFNLSHLITAQSQDGEVINVSGRQRMLSQKIALFSMRYNASSGQAIRQELTKNIELMEKSHHWLTSKEQSQQVYEMYFSEPHSLDERVKNYVGHAKKFLTEKDPDSLSYILHNSQEILQHLDKAVYLYQIENEEKTAILQRNELFLVLIVLFTLLCEALFIFKPANDSIIKKTKELMMQKFNLDMVIESNKNAIMAINDKKEVYTYNQSAEEMFGYSKEEMLGKNSLANIMREDDFKRHDMGVSHFMETGISKGVLYTTAELTGKRKNGELFPLRITFGASSDKKHRIVVANMQDVTHEKERETMMLRQSKLAAMGEMIGAIAHQWRQPLNALNINIENLDDDFQDGEVDKAYIEKFIEEQTDTIHFMSKTIDDFRNFFRIEKEKEQFSIKKAIASTFSIQSAQLNNHNISYDIDGDDFIVDGFKNEFQQVILNVVSNAKDAIVKNGIKGGRISAFIQDGTIKIKDNGGGIAENTIDRIFEPYFTTKEQGEGTGMGLYMSKMIIEDNMGGVINAFNTADGIEFVINVQVYHG